MRHRTADRPGRRDPRRRRHERRAQGAACSASRTPCRRPVPPSRRASSPVVAPPCAGAGRGLDGLDLTGDAAVGRDIVRRRSSSRCAGSRSTPATTATRSSSVIAALPSVPGSTPLTGEYGDMLEAGVIGPAEGDPRRRLEARPRSPRCSSPPRPRSSRRSWATPAPSTHPASGTSPRVWSGRATSTDAMTTVLAASAVLLLVLVPRAVLGRRQVARRLDLILGRCDPQGSPRP